MDELLKELEDLGVLKLRFGVKEKERKKKIRAAVKKLKESEDEIKLKYAKTLYRYYCVINSLGYILLPKDIPVEEDKYAIHYFCDYLRGVVDTLKRSITGVVDALGNDKPIDPFCKYLMFTHMYTPEEVKEIGHEEIYRRGEEFKKELGL